MSDASEPSGPPSGVSVPADIPAEALPFLHDLGYFDADQLRVGDRAPVLRLAPLHGVPLIIGEERHARPVVLIFGSYT